ncbi:hypothetical protein N8510_01315 [bacterium]|nr:hypothetical protein [bacterium]
MALRIREGIVTQAENKRLRGLLERCEPYIHEAFCGVPSRIELIDEIRKELEKEVGDE